MLRAIFRLLLVILPLASCAQQDLSEQIEVYNQPVYMLDTLLYRHYVQLPANTWFAFPGKLPFLDHIESFYPRTISARIDYRQIVVDKEWHGDSIIVSCCAEAMLMSDYMSGLILTQSYGNGQDKPMRYRDYCQQYVRKIKANYPAMIYYYTVEKINRKNKLPK
jgi:hypothetical protein